MSDKDKKESPEGLLAAIVDRLSSPVTGSFILIFLIENWRIPIGLIYENGGAQARINFIEFLFPNWMSFVGHGVFAPAVTTIIYLLSMPKLKDFYSKYIEGIENKRKIRHEKDRVNLVRTSSYDVTLKAALSFTRKGLAQNGEKLREIYSMVKQLGLDLKTHNEFTPVTEVATTQLMTVMEDITARLLLLQEFRDEGIKAEDLQNALKIHEDALAQLDTAKGRTKKRITEAPVYID